MRRYDPEVPEDRKYFRMLVEFRSMGTLHMELTDLVKALPKSALPLYIWDNGAALEGWSTADAESVAEMARQSQENSAGEEHTVDAQLRKNLAKIRHAPGKQQAGYPR